MSSIILYVVAYVLTGLFVGLGSKSFGERGGSYGVVLPAAWGVVGSVACGLASLALMHAGPDRDLVYERNWDSGTMLPGYWVSIFFSLVGAMLAVAIYRLVADRPARLG